MPNFSGIAQKATAAAGTDKVALSVTGGAKYVPASEIAALATATTASYDNAASGLAAVTVQEAIDEIVASPPSPDAGDVPYDNVASGLAATDVQAAIDEIAAGGGGSGDVFGPASAVDSNLAAFDTTTGKKLKDAGTSVAKLRTQSIQIACSDETTALTAGTAKVTFRMPYAFTLTGVRASVTTAPTGSVLTVDINEGGTTILSTKLTIDATEKTSTTAATAVVISDTSLADDAEITIDIDGVGSTIAGAGLKVTLIGYAT